MSIYSLQLTSQEMYPQLKDAVGLVHPVSGVVRDRLGFTLAVYLRCLLQFLSLSRHNFLKNVALSVDYHCLMPT